jgi:6-phosphogluconate dehydrogenase
MLSQKLDATFLDADDYHPDSNVSKMSQGIPLNDEDRLPWLKKLNSTLINLDTPTKDIVLSCSALKSKYRDTLSYQIENKICWIFLHGDATVISKRMMARNHFMPVELLKSQYDALELPDDGIIIDIVNSPEEIINDIINKIKMEKLAEIGLIGLGVMGKSLSRNIAQKGFRINVYNRHVDESEVDIAKNFVAKYDELKNSIPFDKLKPYVESLAQPRKIILMVNAGKAVDSVINELIPLLSPNDIIIDGGNSHYKETERRYQSLKENGINYIGSGVSGGEEGALKGPSIMPGGSQSGYKEVEEILTKIAAKDSENNACCAYIGKGGAGHFVKMVHNGIEYAEMQLIAEVYGILRYGLSYNHEQIADLFTSWSETESGSYLLEITADILRKKENDHYLIDLILDRAGNKGTGSWTTIAACELGVAIPTITAALFARYQSSQYDTRQKASKILPHTHTKVESIDEESIRIAYQQARIINHHQGFDLIATASGQYHWDINMTELARIWTNGCIIRSSLMKDISQELKSDNEILTNDKLNKPLIIEADRLQILVSKIANTSISAPCLSSALSYYNGYKEKQSLANIIQAQRDYFGAHTYERKDSPRGEKYHTQW